jgi:adenylate kinase
MFRLTTTLSNSFASASTQKFFFLFGAPGVGKGTYAKLLKKDLGYNHVSTGDEIRKILKGQVANGFDKNLIEKIRQIVISGGLVSD